MTAYVYVLSPKSEHNISKLGKAENVESRFEVFNRIGYCGFDDWEVVYHIELDDDKCARKTEKLISSHLKKQGLWRNSVKHLYPVKNDYKAGTETYNIDLDGILKIYESIELPRNLKIVELETRVRELELIIEKQTQN